MSHDWHQLLVCTEGAFTVGDISGAWTVPRGAAAWVPMGFRHTVEPMPRARVRTIYLQRDATRRTRRSCAVLALTPLVRAIVDHVSEAGPLVAADAASKRLFGVLVDRLATLRELALYVPAPRRELTLRVVEALSSDPADTPRIRDLAAGLDVSGRTIERAFVADTSMPIGEWRQRSRVCRAIQLLAGGMAVKEVALEVGYESPSAFVTAFKRSVGMTPGKLSSNTKDTKETKTS